MISLRKYLNTEQRTFPSMHNTDNPGTATDINGHPLPAGALAAQLQNGDVTLDDTEGDLVDDDDGLDDGTEMAIDVLAQPMLNPHNAGMNPIPPGVIPVPPPVPELQPNPTVNPFQQAQYQDAPLALWPPPPPPLHPGPDSNGSASNASINNDEFGLVAHMQHHTLAGHPASLPPGLASRVDSRVAQGNSEGTSAVASSSISTAAQPQDGSAGNLQPHDAGSAGTNGHVIP